ncbi:GNAT family N-acetyltransferase [Pseudomonas sp. LRF_L74]|uniref:GNAT family N-acetyltransferase n=1 Tax=Pseudomonas sp. LRF_L74 TaxID=3369422 RepID=UPI003F5FC6AC
MLIELVPTCAEQSPLIRNLYQFYAYESSDWEQEDVDLDGRFYIHDPHLQRYWQEPDWSAQLILVDGFIAGFLLIERNQEPSVDALEFADLFVLRKYRRKGIGSAILRQVITGGGRWLVSFYEQDPLASAFCRRVLEDLPLALSKLADSADEPGLQRYLLVPQP